MKNRLIIAITILILAAAGLSASGGNGGNTSGEGIHLILEEIPASPLSVEETEGLLFMREEEKLARDVYTFLYEEWNIPIFRNIARSEQTHMDATLYIIERYELEDPVGNDVPGVFHNPDLQELYDDLTRTGSTSLEAALVVGTEVEDLDIFDLRRQIEITDNDDLKIVYQNLEKGSRNHLRSFYSQLLRRGGSYEARHISEPYFEKIVHSEGERGGSISDPDFIF